MAQIRLLDAATINKIAAGEVVERPVSIVKELTENALDAGATAVTVEIREGGIAYLRVTDNGCGIPADQVRTAFLRHSTSKITSVEDLLTNRTLGFRGEALASIAAVARVEILTKTEEALTGVRYVIEGGEEKLWEEVACPTGTTLRVENLFFNVPARRKFLRRPAAEAASIMDYMQRLILGHPETAFRYLNGKAQPALLSAGKGDLRACVYTVYGREVVDKLLPIQAEQEGVRISGFISRPQLTRANRSYQSLFINGRWIRSALLEKAIEEAYKDYVVPGTYPVTVLQLEMDPAQLDVNVHPTKMEVRFTQEDVCREALYQAISACLRQQSLISREGDVYRPAAAAKSEPKTEPAGPTPSVSFTMPMYVEKPPAEEKPTLPARPPETEKKETPAAESGMSERIPRGEQITVYEEQFERPASPAEELKEETAPYGKNPEPTQLRLIGQVFDTYWLAEGNGLLYIMDQHAAHERVLYDRFRQLLRNGSIDSQILLQASVFPLDPRDVANLDEWQPLFAQLGFEVEAFGEDAVIVRCVPFIFNGPLQAEDFAALVDLLHAGSRDAARDVLLDRMAMMACKAAVKGNNRMSEAEAGELLEQLFASENPYNCPHGRPTLISMSEYELEKKFKRV